jgi:uncharacterized protein (TIGR03086 family)
MSEISDRYRKVAAAFTERVRSVPDGAWENPAPCQGWVARDVVRHLVGWLPAILAGVGCKVPEAPSVDEDPLAAWTALDGALQAALEDPDVAATEFDFGPSRQSFENAVDMFGTSDVLIHTWDLARATGLDETLDSDEVRRLFEGMQPVDEMIRGEHFGPKVPVPDDADLQTKLIAFTGRVP